MYARSRLGDRQEFFFLGGKKRTEGKDNIGSTEKRKKTFFPAFVTFLASGFFVGRPISDSWRYAWKEEAYPSMSGYIRIVVVPPPGEVFIQPLQPIGHLHNSYVHSYETGFYNLYLEKHVNVSIREYNK